MQVPVSVLVLAAGLGTRMKSGKAKVLHRAGGRTLIEHVVRAALSAAAPEDVVVVTGHQEELVREAVASYGVRFVRQADQRGTGHAVLSAREALAGRGGRVIVLYGDCPLLSAATLRLLLERHAAAGAAATVITTTLDDPTGYGRIVVDAGGRLEAIVEQKAATAGQLRIREVNSGIYCFEAAPLWRHVGEIGAGNPAGEYYLTDIAAILRRAGHEVRTLHAGDSAELLGINTREELAAADRAMRDRKARELMLDGVTIERPETVTVDPDVRIGRDTAIGPFAQILGRTEIGENCEVGACSIVSDSRIAAGVVIGPFSIVNDSEVEAGARIGPYARLRLGNHVEAGAAVGNFVELKKTRLGAGSKAMHLAYLGDSEIGAHVNIGAGTITCNYDGVTKHRTGIGDGAFVGSNATLVAPVEIGAGSYVGAGSVITDPVPPDALALGRERQVVKEGWAKRRRQKRSGDPPPNR